MNDHNTDVPGDWDEIRDRTPEEIPAPERPLFDEDLNPTSITLMAAAWADLATILAVCAGALLALVALGEHPALPAFQWAAVLAVVWWGFSASVLLVVRQGTPGMLLAGVVFACQVSKRRVPVILVAAIIQAVCLGCLGLLGARRSLLTSAAAAALVNSGRDDWQD